MGYRSGVGAMFYARSEKAAAMLKVWWAAVKNEPGYKKFLADVGDGAFTVGDGRVELHLLDVKWYDDYDFVQWFNGVVDSFKSTYICNNQLDGGSGVNRDFCYEFMRIGEEMEDIEQDTGGEHEFRLNVRRELTFD